MKSQNFGPRFENDLSAPIYRMPYRYDIDFGYTPGEGGVPYRGFLRTLYKALAIANIAYMRNVNAICTSGLGCMAGLMFYFYVIANI